jgi:hypothetical protein
MVSHLWWDSILAESPVVVAVLTTVATVASTATLSHLSPKSTRVFCYLLHTMATFQALSNEISLLITENLSSSDLFSLKSLNSFFLDVWMARHWHTVDVDLYNDPQKIFLRIS